MNEKLRLLQQEVSKTVIGNETAVSGIFTALLAGGHVLLESAPGSGKTSLAVTAAKAMGLESNRLNLSPDTQDSDILGNVVLDKESGKIRYRKGAIYTNIFIAEYFDEAPGSAASIITDIMDDGKLNVGGKPIPLPSPFAVIATVERESPFTEPLALEERDRFMIRLPLAYLNGRETVTLIKRNTGAVTIPEDMTSGPVMGPQDIIEMREAVREVALPDETLQYISDIAKASEAHHAVKQGITHRGTVDIAEMARARAYIAGKTTASAEDVRAVLGMTIGHRMELYPEAKVFGESYETVVEDLIKKVRAPKPEKKGGDRE
ncbi:MAG: MoxR family ATPase [Firmicutes bacterium]|nr:MoxR family ATPase [Bacillota bacterium]